MKAVSQWCHWKRYLMTKLIVCCLLCCPLSTQVFNISESLPCTMEPCFTLTNLVTQLSNNHNSNITITLSPEIHTLSVNLTLSNVTNFFIFGSSIESDGTVIACNGTRITFHHVQYVLISGITFQGCGENRI